VIAGRNDMRSEIEEFIRNGWSKAETARGVFSVDNHKVYLTLFDDMADMLAHDAPACTPENVSHKKDAQKLNSHGRNKKF
jgi:hypothetical protein